MSSDDISCSDCRLEIIEKRWTQLLLNWLNKCVHPKNPVKELNARSLVEVINKYKQDICMDDLDKAMLCSDDIEPFIKFKYPILRLRYFMEMRDLTKKMYIMNSILLFHCCVSSIEGMVDGDICVNLDRYEQEMILKFCEKLSEMEVTENNIECAIKDACESVIPATKPYKNTELDHEPPPPKMKSINAEAYAPKPPMSSDKSSIITLTSNASATDSIKKKFNALKFKSSVTVLPSAVTLTSSYNSDVDYVANYGSKSDTSEKKPYGNTSTKVELNVGKFGKKVGKVEAGSERRCQPDCACSRCSPSGQCCGDPGSSRLACEEEQEAIRVMSAEYLRDRAKEKYMASTPFRFNWIVYLTIVAVIMLIIIIAIVATIPWSNNLHKTKSTHDKMKEFRMSQAAETKQERVVPLNSYICKNGLCEKVFGATSEQIYSSLSRCVLLCMGPQLWPFPIGYTYFSQKVVTLATNKLEYKFQSVPSEAVHLYLAEAFKLFLGDLAKLERYTMEGRQENLTTSIKKMYIQMDVETDPDPRIRLDTEESYTVKVETNNNQVSMKLLAASFCGMRHALETLSQLIMLDQNSGYLITLSNVVIKDAPSYKYRGLMIDTGRNFIPVPDIMRTIDAMATCKLNTFHWRISDVTSFPLLLSAVPQLFEYGAYDRNLVYTKNDVKAVVKRAGIRGIRVLIEVSVPGPVGRAWSWVPEATCPTKNMNFTCNNVLCLRLSIQDSVFDILQIIYSEILDMTKIDDVFHLSDSVFSLANCFFLIEEREGFLDKALERLKTANKGVLPKLPIIWYTTHLTKDFEARTWDRFGVQLTEWQPNPSDQFLSRFKVIHSSRWDLSCEVKKQRCKKYRTWQDMYSWKSWRNIEVFTIEGGEAILWTDLVDTGNLDYHLWPRAAAVAERLWSDIALNGTVSRPVYVRLDNHRWRMVLKSIQVQPIWPLYCSFSPGVCLEQIKNK